MDQPSDAKGLAGHSITTPNRLALSPAQQMAFCAMDMLLYLAGSNPQHREPLIRMCADLGDLFQLPER
jgi:hypothetical protein